MRQLSDRTSYYFKKYIFYLVLPSLVHHSLARVARAPHPACHSAHVLVSGWTMPFGCVEVDVMTP